MFFTGRAAKATSHPKKLPVQNSPSPRAPEPTSNTTPPSGSLDRNSRRMGKNRAARLSNPAYPSQVTDHGYKTFNLGPVVPIEKAAEQKGDGIEHSKNRP